MMSTAKPALDEAAALDRLLRFLAVPGVTGQEQAIGQAVVAELLKVGVPKNCISFDEAHKQIPLPTQTGNLLVKLPGTLPGPRLLFMTHLDTVPLCAGAEPVLSGKQIKPAGKTALGGDNRTGVACLVTLLATLLREKLPHPPITCLFTVREESGLWGARFVDLAKLDKPEFGFNVDGSSAQELTLGAVGADRWHVEIQGRAAHAGGHPERGISASLVASLALAEVHRGGWFGKIQKDKQSGTSNVGVFGGADGRAAGEATNVVTDFALLFGESRSHSTKFVTEITNAYKAAFRAASEQVLDHQGRKAKIKFVSRRDYFPFRIPESAPVVKHGQAACRSLGFEPTLRITNGGLDANWLTKHGIPVVTFGAGQRNVHTTEEVVELADFYAGCRLALALATTPR